MIITAEVLYKRYRNVEVLKDVSISCKAGQIVGLLGKNGAGKSTLFKILFGLIKPSSGNVHIHSSRKKPLGGIIEKPAMYEYLSARENLRVFAKVQKLGFSEADIDLSLQKVGLPIDRKDPVKNFSLGMKQRLGIAVALLNNPECLLLDEPFSGLDPIGIKAIRTLIIDLVAREKIGVIISSHIIDELSKICDVLYVINKGAIVGYGETQTLIAKNTALYTLYASGIYQSKIIKKYASEVKKNSAQIKISQEEIPQILQQLNEEGIFITSCVPEIDFDQLFETPDL
ncbi:ABC transporter ATP-binding protein [Galbibacter sp. PAP.153]|uniref:ABC transporter ATP-binding protein n=1 Tax=Galbibacter sp. PAP.153 TaxID=3104623 RepID=UPI00300BCA35